MSNEQTDIIRSPSPYYENIGRIMLNVTGQEIRLSPDDIEKHQLRIADLEQIIESPDVWDEMVDKYRTPGNKINYENCHQAILKHHHAFPLRSIGKTFDLDNFTFNYYHKDELVREVKSGTGDIVFGLSSGNPTEGTIYIGNTYQMFLDQKMISSEDFIALGRAVYKDRDKFTIPAWELNIYGANGIVPATSVNVSKINTLKYDENNFQYDMNNAVLWAVSKGIVSRNGSIPINIHIDMNTFPEKASVWDTNNPNAKLNTDNELTAHARSIIKDSKELSEVVGHAYRKLFTVIMVIAIKSKNPPLYNNIMCMLLTKIKSVVTQSEVDIIGLNVDCIEVSGKILDKFIGEDIGDFKLVKHE